MPTPSAPRRVVRVTGDTRPPRPDRRFVGRWLLYVVAILAGTSDPAMSLQGWAQAVAVIAVVAACVAAWVRVSRPWLFVVVGVVAAPVLGMGVLYPALVAYAVRDRGKRLAVVIALALAARMLPTLAGEGALNVTVDGVAASPDGLWRIGAHVVLVALAVLLGAQIGTRRELLASLRDRAERAESERAMRAREAVLLERARIAREMHDVLGHKISLVTMQAGALEVHAGAGAEVVEKQAEQIRLTAREALTDLRAVIGALEENDAALAPGPGLAEVPALVERYRAAGAVVTLVDEVSELPPPDRPVSLAVHRVLTEALTNAHRHAPGEPVSIRLTGSPGERLTVLVENPVGDSAPNPGGGTGLPGLGERVRLAGGQFEAGPRGAIFGVRASFPWAAATARESAS